MNREMLACMFRHYLWRIVCSFSGGLTVTGRWPHSGGCILVANHSSHADTAVLLAALPPRAQLVFAAASDYWFDVPVRRFLITSLAGGLPVRRTDGGTYAALLTAVKPALAQGRTVVIFPEGTRTRDGTMREFRSGALHLARDCGVPIVPVAILGTGDVLPANGRYSPSHPMEVRFTDPVDPATTPAADLQRAVIALRDEHPVRERQSRVWSAIARVVTSPYGLLLAFLWGYAEALSWFIVAEMALILFAAAVPRRVMPWAAAVIGGSVLGVLTNAWLTSRGVLLPAPLTTTRMAATAFHQLAAGPSAIMHQAFSGIPVKVYARAAGEHSIHLWNLAGWTLLERGLRISMVGLAVWLLSKLLHPWLGRLYGVYFVVVAVLFTASLAAVIAAWS